MKKNTEPILLGGNFGKMFITRDGLRAILGSPDFESFDPSADIYPMMIEHYQETFYYDVCGNYSGSQRDFDIVGEYSDSECM